MGRMSCRRVPEKRNPNLSDSLRSNEGALAHAQLKTARRVPQVRSLSCLVPIHPLQSVPRHPLQLGSRSWGRNPMLDDRRALDLRVELTHECCTVKDHPAPVHRHDLHAFTGQSLTDRPLAPFDFQLPLTVDFQNPSAGGIFPAGWMRIVAFCTGRPHTCGCSHIQGFMWPHVVVFPTILVEPSLQVSLWNPSSPPCAFQRSVKPLDLPLRLRMPYTTPVP